jgi:hypothetical protein
MNEREPERPESPRREEENKGLDEAAGELAGDPTTNYESDPDEDEDEDED